MTHRGRAALQTGSQSRMAPLLANLTPESMMASLGLARPTPRLPSADIPSVECQVCHSIFSYSCEKHDYVMD